MSTITCLMYCPMCRKGYKISNVYLQEFFVMIACDKCSKDGEFKFTEQIF